MDSDSLYGWFEKASGMIFATTVVAKFQKGYYDALVTEGFAEQEALRLCELVSAQLIQTLPAMFKTAMEEYGSQNET